MIRVIDDGCKTDNKTLAVLSASEHVADTAGLHGDKIPLIVTDMWPVYRSRSSARFRVREPDSKTSLLSGYQSVKYQQLVNGVNQT